MKRGWLLLLGGLFLSTLFLAGNLSAQAKEVIWQENFESYADNAVFPAPAGGEVKDGLVKAGLGFKESKALAARSFKVSLPLEPGIKGPIWIRYRVKPSAGNRQLSMSASTNLSGVFWTRQMAADKEQPAYTQLIVKYFEGFRVHQPLKLSDAEWTTMTVKLDDVGHSQATWLNDILLVGACELPAQPFLKIDLAFEGVAEQAVLIDDLVVTTARPEGLRDQPNYPAKKAGHLFRFAAMGDPQPGLDNPGNYRTHLEQFRRAIRQVNEAGAEFTIILGDLVNDGKVDTTYQDIVTAVKDFKKPWYPVRGNHDAPDKFKQYFRPETNYAFEHQGFRFVVLDAVGSQEELTAGQLAFAEKEFQAAASKKQEIVVCTHVSAWDRNPRGASPYMQIGPESKAKLKELFKKYNALLMLSGHYHRGPWYAQEEGMNYLVLPGPAMPKGSPSSWQIFDVYPDRVEIFTKQIFMPYDDEAAAGFINTPYLLWQPYPPDGTRVFVIKRNAK